MSSKRPGGSKKKSGAQSQGEQPQATIIGPGELRRRQSSMLRPSISPSSLSLDRGAARHLEFDAASAQFPPFTRPPPVRPQFMPTPRMPQYEPSYAHAQASFSQSPLQPSPSHDPASFSQSLSPLQQPPSQPYHARASFSQSPQLEPSPSGAADEATPSSQPSGDDDGGDVDPDVASTSTLDPDGLW